MCRLVFSITDNHQVAEASPDLKPRLRQAGDLIAILPDETHAGNSVEESDRFLIIDCPAISESEFEHLLDSDETSDGPKRLRNVDLNAFRDQLDIADKAKFDNTRRVTLKIVDRRKIHDSTKDRN